MRRARVIAFALVVAIHAIAIMYFPAARRSLAWITEDDTTRVFFLPLARTQQTAPSAKTRLKPSTRKRLSEDTERRAPTSPIPATPTPADDPTAYPFDPFTIDPTPATTPTAIDWAREAEQAAADSISAEETVARQRAALTPRHASIGAHTRGNAPRFAWSEAQTQRVQSIPGGGMLIYINDRCAIVIPMILMTICKIGKMESRGDLFQHMEDAPQARLP